MDTHAPLVLNSFHLRAALQRMTGNPLDRYFNSEERERLVARFETTARRRLIGQQETVKQVANVLRGRLAFQQESLEEMPVGIPRLRPLANLLLAGPTGVGKTEMAKILAETLFGATENLITVNCSTISEEAPHAAARLVGSPPGYIGWGSGGELTRPLTKGLNQVILFDEVEKMARSVARDILIPALDEGVVVDQENGAKLSLAGSVIVCTTNLGVGTEGTVGFGASEGDTAEASERRVRGAIASFFPPEVLARFDSVVVFQPWTDETIVELGIAMLTEWVRRKSTRKPVVLELSDAEEEAFYHDLKVAKTYGARAVEGVVSKSLRI